MSSRLHKLTLAILLLPLLLVVVALFLPSRYRVERSQRIHAPAQDIFPSLNTLKSWPEWTTWTLERFPDLKMTYAGPEAGVGAVATWSGKQCGTCTRTITMSEPNRALTFNVTFQPDRFMSKGAITLEPSGESVKVTWTQEGELGWSPVARFFGLLMENMLGPDLEQSLRNLKVKVESSQPSEGK